MMTDKFISLLKVKHFLFILEALEYEIALFVLEFADLVISAHVVVFKAHV
jgi:hypothetical protein